MAPWDSGYCQALSRAGSGSIPLVNLEGDIVGLPISGSDHVIEHQGAGGPQSLFAIGSPNFIGDKRKMICLFAQDEQGDLISAYIDNTGDTAAMRPANVPPLGYRQSDTSVVPVVGQPMAVESKASLEKMRQLALAVLKRVDAEHQYVRKPANRAEVAVNTARRMQLNEADARVYVNAAALMPESDTSDDSDSEASIAGDGSNIEADGVLLMYESSDDLD